MLSADVVPPERFSRHHWLLPVDVPHRSGWHYALSRGGAHPGSVNVDPDTLDPALRPIVVRLNRRGVRTLPSCEGHYGWCPRRVERAARDLAQQAPLIRRGGVVMRDVETGELHRIRDADWQPPTHADLLDGVRAVEGIGFLRFYVLNGEGTATRYWRDGCVLCEPRYVTVWAWAPTAKRQRAFWYAADRHLRRVGRK